jgi:uncharacterized membrane protein
MIGPMTTPKTILATGERPRFTTGEPPRTPLLFDARLTPHRSLSRFGFLILMIAVGTVSFIAGLAFFLAGAWPVVGFLGLDVALVYIAFRVTYRRARAYETLRLTRDNLLVEHVTHRGQKRTWRFQPYWLQVFMDEPASGPEIGPETGPKTSGGRLLLRSHGRSLEIAGFLAPAERADLARALREALARARAACTPCPPAQI